MATIDKFEYPPNCPSCGPIQERVVDLDQLNVFESVLAHIGPMIAPFIVGIVVGMLIMLFTDDDHSTVGVDGRTSAGDINDPGDF